MTDPFPLRRRTRARTAAFALTTLMALAAAATPLVAQETPAVVADPSAIVSDRQGFAERAMAGNRFEIETSKLAQQRTKTPEVLAFAERMIADHGVANDTLAEAMREDKISAEATLSTTQQASLDALRAAPDDQFDIAYLSAQMTAHEEATGLYDGYMKSGEAGALRRYAETTMPALVMHRKQVQQLAGQ